jgi:hypothetical protein
LVKDKFGWDLKKTAIALIAAVIPFGTFYVEKKMITN